MIDLRGTYVVSITPMNDKQEVDIEQFKRNIDWFIEEGVPGVCILGGTGEFSSLSHDERVYITREIVPYVNKRIGCIVGTAAESTEETVILSTLAEDVGADGVMIINPYYCRPTYEELAEHYKTVSESISIPIMIYNNPAHSGVDIVPEVLAQLAEIENVKLVKDATGDIKRLSSIQRLAKGGLRIFCGGEDVAFENFLLGAEGWICVCGNIIPRQSTMLFDLMDEGNITQGKELFESIYPLLEMLETQSKPIQRVKYAMDLIGHASGPSRAPRQDLSTEEKQEVSEVLKKLQLL